MKCDATYSKNAYLFLFQEEHISIEMKRLEEKHTASGGIQCEIRIESSDPISSGLLHSGNFNLLTANAALVNKLVKRVDLDWDGVLTHVADLAKTQYRKGEPVVDLANVELGDRSRWLLPGFIEDTVRATLIAAGGGTGKSTFGLAAAMSVATAVPFLGIHPERICRTLYMDWEADEQIHAERAQALWAGQNLEGRFDASSLYWQRQAASLRELIESVKETVVEHEIGFAVIDSIGMARGGAPEDASATIKLFEAIRQMEIPVLAIDHMSKEALSNKQARQSAIGSVYTENAVCRVWIMKNSEETLGVTLEDVKRNNTRKQRTLGYKVHYQNDGTLDQRAVQINYESTDFRDLDSSVQPSGQKYQIINVIKHNDGEPVSIKDLAEATGMSAANVRTVVNRSPESFEKMDGLVGIPTEIEALPF